MTANMDTRDASASKIVKIVNMLVWSVFSCQIMFPHKMSHRLCLQSCNFNFNVITSCEGVFPVNIEMGGVCHCDNGFVPISRRCAKPTGTVGETNQHEDKVIEEHVGGGD